MKGLFLKDWYQVRSYMKRMYGAVFAVMLIWAVGASDTVASFAVSYMALFLGIMPCLLLSYDQSSGWTEYSMILPVGEMVCVTEKYLIGLFCAGTSLLVSGIFTLVLWFRGVMMWDGSVLFQMGMGAAAILLMNALFLPLIYRFGMEKAQLFYLLMFAVGGALLGGSAELFRASASVLSDAAAWLLQTPAFIAVLGTAVALLLYAVSWRLSVAWYGKYQK